MKRREIIDEAKGLILNHGPANMVEFGYEIIQSSAPPEWTAEERSAIADEAVNQARRVYEFLGFAPFWRDSWEAQ